MNSPITGLICGMLWQGWQYARIAAVHFHHFKASNVFFIYFIDECQMRYSQNGKEINTRKKEKEGKSVPGVVGVDDTYPLPQ